ncbi:MAG: long-chain acyl-CoA synthetase [Candidatus Saganbacteria bacterium]|uniref:Long-chain acyl-CoA synthetase n=1 Tax=Candidatus Saganbacteria bacterium TaxID=2575572 RepID=A0A833L2H2_UNCSA|nr:MAG: long-chain acyl-CoA synthetase [Candidatus Saganbacteria bacterium]
MELKDCKNFSEVLYYQSRINPDKVFISDVRSGRCYYFKEFNLIVEKASNYLLSKGIERGDRITALIENSPEYCFLYFAALRIGAIFNPMPFTSHKEEVKKNISYVGPSIVLVDARRFNEFAGERASFVEVPVGEERLFEKSLEVHADSLRARVEIDENCPACLYYSSGTTGDPKGVLFSHKNMIADISSVCRGFDFMNDNEVHLVFLPLGHTASTNYSFLPCMYAGGKMILAESFWQIRNRIWELIQKERVNYMEVVPTVLYSILNIYQDTKGCDVSSMKFVGCGSAPLQKSIQIEFEKKFGLKTANLYGLSETGPTHIDDPRKPDWEPGRIGVPLDVNEVKIVDENDRELSPNEIGEIVVKGANVFVGYYKNEKLYKEVMRNGFFHTGDLGYKNEQGIYYFVDRKKDLIIKGGSNVMPGEIDEVLLLNPAVKEAATIGMPDDLFGEEIKSFIVLRDNCLIESEEILEHCKKYLSALKLPKVIEIVASIPQTHSGKLLKKDLREKSKVIINER